MASEHVDVRWREPESTPTEAKIVLEHAERSWERIATILGPGRAPQHRLTIRLEGDAERGEIPTVDLDTGEVVLVRLQGVGGAYESSLTHEMVHAFRLDLVRQKQLQTDAFIYLEELLAELVAMEAGFPSQGFPTYGYPVEIVAGAWIERDEDLPIPTLIRHHLALNFRCLPQAYGLRLAFGTWLRSRVGLDRLIQLGYKEEPLTPEGMEQALGSSLASLSAEWRKDAAAQFETVKEGTKKAREYRERTPIQYFPVCTRDALAEFEVNSAL